MRCLFAIGILLVFIACVPVSAEETSTHIKTTLLWEEYCSPHMYAVALAGDGTAVACAGDQGVKILAEDGKVCWMAEIPHACEIALSKNASRMLVGGITLQLFDQTGTEIWRNTTSYFVLSGAISPEGDLVYSAWDDSTLLRYNMTSMALYNPHFGTDLICMAVTDNGAYVVGGTLTGDLILWDIQGNVRWTRTCPGEKPVRDLALSSDGSSIAYTIDDQVYLINRAGRTLWSSPLPHAAGVSMSAEGFCIAVAHGNGISLFNREGTQIATLQKGEKMLDVSLADDGTRLAACDQNNTYLYAITTEEPENITNPQQTEENVNQQERPEDSRDPQTLPTSPVTSGNGALSVLSVTGSILATVLLCSKRHP